MNNLNLRFDFSNRPETQGFTKPVFFVILAEKLKQIYLEIYNTL